MKVAIYSRERRESVVAKLLAPGAVGVQELARQEGISTATLYNWRRQSMRGGGPMQNDGGKNPDSWSAEEKFDAVVEAAALNEAELAEYCRRRGLYAEQVDRWRAVCRQANGPGGSGPARGGGRAEDRRRIRRLEKELDRKDKALSETAALLVLQKKLEAVWGKGEAG